MHTFRRDIHFTGKRRSSHFHNSFNSLFSSTYFFNFWRYQKDVPPRAVLHFHRFLLVLYKLLLQSSDCFNFNNNTRSPSAPSSSLDKSVVTLIHGIVSIHLLGSAWLSLSFSTPSVLHCTTDGYYFIFFTSSVTDKDRYQTAIGLRYARRQRARLTSKWILLSNIIDDWPPGKETTDAGALIGSGRNSQVTTSGRREIINITTTIAIRFLKSLFFCLLQNSIVPNHFVK